jgi:Ca2+-binding RTX toxin-like protein
VLAAQSPNLFLHTGSGSDAMTVSSGIAVLDGGTGSNFLIGGGGNDTFFADDRNATADIWDTIADFHGGDPATVWGITPQDFNLAWVDGQGAPSYTGLTLHATAAGKPTASLTLVGFATGDMTAGHLTISYGTDAGSGSPYMSIQAH